LYTSPRTRAKKFTRHARVKVEKVRGGSSKLRG
jgi:hypothetical protein